MKTITKREYFALRILLKLMDRSDAPGYYDDNAIKESYRLADVMMSYEKEKNNEI